MIYIFKILLYPIFLFLIALFSTLIMLSTKQIKNITIKILIGLFFSVIIYYFNNFSHALGTTERVPLIISIISPMLLLASFNFLMLYKVNDK